MNINTLNTDSSTGLIGAYLNLGGVKRVAEATRFEARSAESGDGVLGEGLAKAPSQQLQGLGERCKLPQRGPGRSHGCQAILLHLKYSGRPLLIAEDA